MTTPPNKSICNHFWVPVYNQILPYGTAQQRVMKMCTQCGERVFEPLLPNKSTGDDVSDIIACHKQDLIDGITEAVLPLKAQLQAAEASAAQANARAEASEAELARTKRWIHDHEKLFAADALQAQVDALRKSQEADHEVYNTLYWKLSNNHPVKGHLDGAMESADAIIAQLKAAEARCERYAWRPIETCPSDVPVLLYTPNLHITNRERVEARVYHDSKAGSYHAWATHWMPIPDGPKAIAEQALADGSAMNREGEP